MCILHTIVQYDNSSFNGNIIYYYALQLFCRVSYTLHVAHIYSLHSIIYLLKILLFYSFDEKLPNKIIQYEYKSICEYVFL